MRGASRLCACSASACDGLILGRRSRMHRNTAPAPSTPIALLLYLLIATPINGYDVFERKMAAGSASGGEIPAERDQDYDAKAQPNKRVSRSTGEICWDERGSEQRGADSPRARRGGASGSPARNAGAGLVSNRARARTRRRRAASAARETAEGEMAAKRRSRRRRARERGGQPRRMERKAGEGK